MFEGDPSQLDLSAVPLFPLPNVVLFPRAVLPLHIFEERYKAMTADALAGDRIIAMALLRAGWEKNYHGRAEIEPTVCVGQIVSDEQLADGRYNFLLQGLLRAQVVEERSSRDLPYRIAQLSPLEQTRPLEIDLVDHREKFARVLADGPLSRACMANQFRQMLTSPLPTQDIADLIAFYFFEDIPLKQSLLAESDVVARVDRTLRELRSVASQLPSAAAHVPAEQIDYSARHPDLN